MTVSRLAEAQRWVLAATIFFSAAVMWPGGVEPFMLPKVTVIQAAAVVLAALWAAKVAVRRTLLLPVAAGAVAVVLFAGGAVLATVTSSSPWTSLIGVTGRYTGLSSYLAYAIVFVTAISIWDESLSRRLRRSAVLAIGVVVTYGLAQVAGMEPLSWREDVASTMGNIDFSAAWVGATSALLVATAFLRSEAREWRTLAAVLLPSALGYVVLTTTSQGPVVALVSVGWALSVAAWAPGGWFRSRPVFGLAAVGLAGLTAVVAAVASWSFLKAQLDQAMVERPDFWLAAWWIFQDYPVFGTGLDTYGHFFLQYRPASHAVAYGLIQADSPHSVPLAMLSNGGLVLGLAHLAFVATVAFLLGRAALRLDGSNQGVIMGFGGVWLGYQAQALISYDVPPLALLHWLSAAAIVAAAAPIRFRVVQMPGPAATRAKVRGRAVGPVVVPRSTRVSHAVIAALAALALWVVIQPFRADVTAARAAAFGAAGQLDQAAEVLREAADINPAEGEYLFQAARAVEAAQRPAEAADLAAAAARRDPGAAQYALLAARQALVAGDFPMATEWYLETTRRDPRHPAVLAEAAAFFAERGDADRAEAFALRAQELDPSSQTAQEVLAGLERRS